MTIRRFTEADEAVVRELWEEFENEVPEPAHRLQPPIDQTWEEIRKILVDGIGLLVEDEQGPVALGLAKLDQPACVLMDVIYVRPRGRRAGIAKALMASAVEWGTERGATHMTLEVLAMNHEARAAWERLGFEEESSVMFAPLQPLAERLTATKPAPSFGSIHVQTDDFDAVVRAVQQFVPRLPGGSRGSVVAQPANGWTALYDELCDREPEMLRRLALEISDRMGAVVCAIGIEEAAVVRFVLFERGRVMDEYASVPEYHGPLPPGDVVALSANPTVVGRLTGADAALVRERAKTAERPSDLPPPGELLEGLTDVLGLAGTSHGYEQARSVPGAAVVDRV